MKHSYSHKDGLPGQKKNLLANILNLPSIKPSPGHSKSNSISSANISKNINQSRSVDGKLGLHRHNYSMHTKPSISIPPIQSTP
jgi:hypothetical protein